MATHQISATYISHSGRVLRVERTEPDNVTVCTYLRDFLLLSTITISCVGIICISVGARNLAAWYYFRQLCHS